jgi:hypothetical protein
MNEEQVKELLSNLKEELLEAVDQKNQGLATNLSKKVKGLEEKFESAKPAENDSKGQGEEGKLSMKALQQQIQQLNQQLAEKDKAAFEADRNSKINEVIGNSDAQAKEILSRQIKTLYGDKLTKEEGQWFVKDGEDVKPFDEVFSEYLQSDEGKFFLPPNPAKGTGSQQSDNSAAVQNSQQDSKDAQILEALSGF